MLWRQSTKVNEREETLTHVGTYIILCITTTTTPPNEMASTRFINNDSGSSPNTTIVALIEKYGPVHFTHPDVDVSYKPVSMEYLFPHFEPIIANDRDDSVGLIIKQDMPTPSSTFDWFRSTDDPGPFYIYLRPHTELGADYFVLDFSLVFPNNLGKEVFGVEFGDHVLDFTHSWIVFDARSEPPTPVRLGHQYHHMRSEFDWPGENLPTPFAGEVVEYYDTDNDHPVWYHAKRGSEVYPVTGMIPYENVGPSSANLQLTDNVRAGGPEFRSWENYVLITPANYYGISNRAYDHRGDPVSLTTPYPGIDNWPWLISFMGSPPSGHIRIPYIISESDNLFRQSGAVMLFPQYFRNKERGANSYPITAIAEGDLVLTREQALHTLYKSITRHMKVDESTYTTRTLLNDYLYARSAWLFPLALFLTLNPSKPMSLSLVLPLVFLWPFINYMRHVAVS